MNATGASQRAIADPCNPSALGARWKIVSFGIAGGLLGIVGAGPFLAGAMTPVIDEILSHNFTDLPVWIGLTLSRMTLAYLLSLGFALAYGIPAGMSHRASHVLLPLLDILQSVPVLGFLPAVFLFFIGVPFVGADIAAIILIFTAMAWAPTFGVIAGVNAIPQDIKEAARSYGMSGWRFYREIVLPAVFPQLVWGSILAWGGGWYLIPVEEYTKFGGTSLNLHGIGFYIADAANSGQLARSIFGLIVLVMVILAIDRLVWKPLEDRAERYKYESVAGPSVMASRETRILSGIRKYEGRIASPIVSFLKYQRAQFSSVLDTLHLRPRLSFSERVRFHERWRRHQLLGRTISFGIFLALLVGGVSLLLRSPVFSIQSAVAEISSFPSFQPNPGLAVIYYTGRSLLRLLSAYLIALSWTLLAGIVVARRASIARFLVPVFDVGQSIPATALFPIIVLLLLPHSPGVSPNPLNLDIASILLILTGMQWYLLFNIIGSIHNFPTDILEAAKSYGIRGRRFVRQILVPASFPAIIIGSMQAWGGGWNATIVSEYITNPNAPSGASTVPGLGSTLVQASVLGDAAVLGLSILVMSMTVVLLNRLVWRRLLRKAERFKFEQ